MKNKMDLHIKVGYGLLALSFMVIVAILFTTKSVIKDKEDMFLIKQHDIVQYEIDEEFRQQLKTFSQYDNISLENQAYLNKQTFSQYKITNKIHFSNDKYNQTIVIYYDDDLVFEAVLIGEYETRGKTIAFKLGDVTIERLNTHNLIVLDDLIGLKKDMIGALLIEDVDPLFLKVSDGFGTYILHRI